MTMLTRISLHNRLIVGLITVAILGFGVFVAGTLKQELWPSTTPPGADVSIDYPGASPASVEKDATAPLEQAISAVAGVSNVESISQDGAAYIIVNWDFGKDVSRIEAEIRAAVTGVKSSLPATATAEVFAGARDAHAAMELTIGASKDPAELAERVSTVVLPALRAVPGVADAKVAGQDAAELSVAILPAELHARGLTAEAVSTAIRESGQSVAAGTSTDGADHLSIQVKGGAIDTLEGLRALPLQHKDGPSPLSAVADVQSIRADRTTIARANGMPSLNVSITKDASGNLVQISHAVRALFPELESALGSSASITAVADQAPEIEHSVADLAVEGGLGLLFAVIVILVFLGSLRSTLIAAVSIPLSLLITLIVLWLMDATLNVFSLAALTVAVGRVVDDSIVVIENIVRRGRQTPMTVPALIESVRQVAGAVIASTLTTVAVFLPIAFVPGATGELFRPFAATVSIALLASLVVSLTIVPVFAYWFLRHGSSQSDAAAPEDLESADNDESERRPSRLERWYLPVLDHALRRPIAAGLVAVLVFGGTVAAIPLLKQDFLGDTAAKDRVDIFQELESGASLDQTDVAAQQVEHVLSAHESVDSYLTTVGAADAPNTAYFTVQLREGSDRGSVEKEIRSAVKKLTDVGRVNVGNGGGAGGGGGDLGAEQASFMIDLQGNDAGSLAVASAAVTKMIGDISGLVDPWSDLANESPMLAVNVDRTAAARYGFTVEQVGAAVSTALRGTEAGTIVLDGKEHRILLHGTSVGSTPADIAAMPLPISATQQEAAVKAATDAIQAEMDERAQVAKNEAAAAQAKARKEARTARAEAIAQFEEAQAQLDAYLASPGDNTSSSIPDANGQAGPLAELRSAVEAAQAAVAGANEQLSLMDKQDAEAVAQEAQAVKDKQAQDAISTLQAAPIPISAVADVVRENAPAQIRRVDGIRTVTISAGIVDAELSTVKAAVRDRLQSLDLPSGVTPVLGGVAKEQEESFDSLGAAMLVALLLVFIILVAMFRSLTQTLMLLVSVPFAATGAVGGLLITGTALGTPALIGLLMLIGIVVTNAIVLLDLVNSSRRNGMSIHDAVRHGARLRLRPIIMTACATVGALVPMALGLTGGGAFISQSLAIVVIGGLASSTLLTLVLVPVLYTCIERGKERRHLNRTGSEVTPAG